MSKIGKNTQKDFTVVTRENFWAWNEEMIEKYDPDFYHTRSSFFIKMIIKLMIIQILKFMNVKPGNRVLEVGCGAGNVLEKLKRPGALLFGVDLSEKLLKKAGVRCAGDAVLTAGDAVCIPMQSKSFDRVICTEVIEHLLFPEHCLMEIVRVAKDDSIVVVTTTNELFVNRVKALIWKFGFEKLFAKEGGYQPDKKMDDEWHLHAFDPDGFKKMLNKYLRVEKFMYVPSRFFPIQMIARCRKK